MSQNADSTPVTDSSGAGDVSIDSDTTIDLQIISPSVGVTGPISLPQLSINTTVRQLKEKIREALPIRPSLESQRLIYSGRMLSQDSEPLSEVFGRDITRSSRPRTLHLVLRPAASEPVSSNTNAFTTSNTSNVQEPRTHDGQRPPGLPMPRLPNLGGVDRSQLAASTARITENMQRLQQSLDRMRANFPLDGAIPSGPQFGTTAGTAAQVPPAGTSAVAHLGPDSPLPQLGQFPTPQIQNPPQLPLPTFQNLLAQQQQQRAALGLHGAQQGNGVTYPLVPRIPGQNYHGVPPTRTYSQEGVGPNGDRWRINVTESITPLYNNPLQNQHRNQIPRPGVPGAGPTVPNQTQPERSSSAPPPMNGRPSIPATSNSFSTPPVVSTTQAASNTTLPSSNRAPVVYLLSTPAGPRALLVNGNGESFYSGRQFSTTIQGDTPNTATTLPESRNRAHRPHRHRARRDGNVPVADNNAAAAIPQLHPHNPPAARLFRGLVGPHLWLIVRLLVFVWFFIAPNSSWWRVFTIWGIALLIFCANTGIFRGAADIIFGPLRRHLQRLLPLHGPEPVLPAGQGQNLPLRPDGGRRGELDPERVAARLIEQRRINNESWLMTQLRRVEHGAVLFLASLVPGIGERHIAAREAEANIAAVAEAERLRQEEAAANPAVEGAEGDPDGTQGVSSASGAEAQTQPGSDDQGGVGGPAEGQGVDRAQVPPLVEV